MGNVARGLVPRWGGAWAWQNPPREIAAQNRDSVFSSLGVPAPTGMSDCYENMMKSLTAANWRSTIFILLCGLHDRREGVVALCHFPSLGSCSFAHYSPVTVQYSSPSVASARPRAIPAGAGIRRGAGGLRGDCRGGVGLSSRSSLPMRASARTIRCWRIGHDEASWGPSPEIRRSDRDSNERWRMRERRHKGT